MCNDLSEAVSDVVVLFCTVCCLLVLLFFWAFASASFSLQVVWNAVSVFTVVAIFCSTAAAAAALAQCRDGRSVCITVGRIWRIVMLYYNFPVLRSTCIWRVTSYMGKSYANSAFHPFGVDKWVVSCNLMSTLVAPSGECLLGRWCVRWLLPRIQLFVSAYNGRPH